MNPIVLPKHLLTVVAVVVLLLHPRIAAAQAVATAAGATTAGTTMATPAVSPPSATTVAQMSGATTVGPSPITLMTRRTVRGRVARADGTPVANATFYVQDLNQSPPATVATVSSAADGTYAITLEWGRWRVIATSPDYDFQPDHRDYVVGF